MSVDSAGGPGRLSLQAARAVMAVLGLALLANAAWLAATANLTLGTALVADLGFAFIAAAVWFARLSRHRLLILLGILVCVGIIGLSGFLTAHGNHDDASFDEDAVIVLGAAVHGRELSNTLAGRLAMALDFHRRDPGALIVVSGGQGPQEEIAEAVAMRQYLLDHGVPADQIVLEDRSTSTEENFANSKVLLDQRLQPGYTVVFVTDEFHVYRAGRIAAAAGLTARHVSSRTPWYFWPANYLRETVAVVVHWFRG